MEVLIQNVKKYQKLKIQKTELLSLMSWKKTQIFVNASILEKKDSKGNKRKFHRFGSKKVIKNQQAFFLEVLKYLNP